MAHSPDESVLRRARIQSAASKLFAEHGFEGATFAMIAHAADSAIGSLTHFYRDKAGLAAVVHAAAADELAAVLAEPLRQNGPDIRRAVKALIITYFTWAKANPDRVALLVTLDRHVALHGSSYNPGLQGRIEQVLETWAAPIIRQRVMPRLTPEQLFAIIMAPAMSCHRVIAGSVSSDPAAPLDWPELLASAAEAAVQQAGAKLKGRSQRT